VVSVVSVVSVISRLLRRFFEFGDFFFQQLFVFVIDGGPEGGRAASRRGSRYIRDTRERLTLETFSSSVRELTCIDTICPRKV
jgi:hypothetical protein